MAKIRYIVRVVQADKEIVLRVPVAPETTVGQLQAEVLARANKKGFLGTTCELSVAGASLDEADHLEDVVDEGETIEATLASAAPTPAPATQFVFGSGAPSPASPASPFVFGATSPAASSPASPAFSFNAPPPAPPASASTSTPKLRLTEPPTPPTPPALPLRRPAAPPIAQPPHTAPAYHSAQILYKKKTDIIF